MNTFEDVCYVPTMKKFRVYYTKTSGKEPKEYDLTYDTMTKLYSTIYEYDQDILFASPIYTDQVGQEIHHWHDENYIRRQHTNCPECLNPGVCSQTQCKVSFSTLFPIYAKPPWYQCVKNQ